MVHTDVATRLIGAAPEQVFAALTNPDDRAAWLPPSGMTGRFEWFDARPGGGYRMVLTYDDPRRRGKSEHLERRLHGRLLPVVADGNKCGHRRVYEPQFIEQ